MTQLVRIERLKWCLLATEALIAGVVLRFVPLFACPACDGFGRETIARNSREPGIRESLVREGLTLGPASRIDLWTGLFRWHVLREVRMGSCTGNCESCWSDGYLALPDRVAGGKGDMWAAYGAK